MGVFGTGLYSGDFAMDLRSAIGAVARLPFDSDKLVEILSQTEPAAATDPGDSDHTIFWLVLADQFTKRGIVCEQVRDKALGIIDSEADVRAHEKLGMDATGLRKRRKVLQELRARVSAPQKNKPRSVLQKPQPLLMNVGDVLVYPTFGGRCRNPYFASKEQDQMGTSAGPWTQDGWSAMVIIDCGRAFDFLAWYRPLTISTAVAQKPTIQELRGGVLWRLARAGTCSPVHFKRMEFEKIGALAIDAGKLRRVFSDIRPGISQAVEDISIANAVSVEPYLPAALTPRPGEAPSFSRGRPYLTILGIEQILSA